MMSWEFSGYAFLLFLSAGVSTLVAYIAWQRKNKLSKYIAPLMLAVAVWSLANGLEATVLEMPAKIFFGKLSYLGAYSVPPLFLMLVLAYGNKSDWLTRLNITVLWLIPLLTMGLVFFNEWHGLIWSSISFLPGSNERILIYHRGPYFWLQTFYSYVVILVATILLFRMALRSPRPYKSQAWIIITAALIPWTANILYLLRWEPFSGRNLTQVSFLLTGLLFIWGIYRHQVFDLTPIARDRILDTLPDAIITIDALGQTIDLNPAACRLLDLPIESAIGKPVASLLSKWPYLARQLESVENLQDSTLRNTFQDVSGRWYFLTLSRLMNAQQERIGWVLWMRDITKQRMAEHKVSRLAKVIEQAQETIVITDLDGKITYANPYFEKTTGYMIEEVLGQNPRILKSGKQDEQFYASMWDTISSGQSWSEIFVNKRKDGSLYHEAATIFPIINEFGEKTHYAAVKRNISNQVEAENSQRQFTQNLETLHEINLALSQIISFDEICRQAVIMARDRLNFSRIGLWFVDLEDPNWLQGSFGLDENGEIRDEHQQFIESASPVFETLVDNKQRVYYDPNHELLDHKSQSVGKGETAAAALWDGKNVIGFVVIDNLLSQEPISNHQRELLYLFGQTIGNLASKKRAEIAMLENERRYRLLADNALDVIWTMDLQGKFTYVSPSIKQLRGYTPEEVLGQSMHETLTPESLEIAQKAFDEMLATVQAGEQYAASPYYELEQPCKDGSTVWTEVITTLMYDQDDAPLGILGVTRDITERKKAEKSLQEYANRQALLNAITQTAIQQADFDEMLQTLADRMGKLLGADSIYITLWDEESQSTILAAAYGNLHNTYQTTVYPQPGETTLTESVLTHGDVIVIKNALETPHLSKQIAASFPARAGLALPLIANNQKLGAALIAFNTPREFTQAEIDIGKQAAQQIALAILKNRLLEEAQQRAKEAETLRLASAAIVGTLERDQAIERILEELNRVVPYDSASVLLSRGTELEIVGSRGFENKDEILGLRFPITRDRPNTVVSETRLPFILDNASAEYEAFRHPPYEHIRGWMGVPLLMQDKMLGMLALDSKIPNRFTQDHARLASAFASQVVIALENARLFEETRRLAITDSLTDLFNRRHFMELARREFERSNRYKTPLSVIMLDIDHFKKINDTYGHLIGDQVLQITAFICRKNLRSIDLIGRYGGEEFIILLPETPLSRPTNNAIETKDLDPLPAQIVAERLRETIARKHFQIAQYTIQTTISLGTAEFTISDKNIETVIDHADQALLKAKNEGRNRVVTWTPEEYFEENTN